MKNPTYAPLPSDYDINKVLQPDISPPVGSVVEKKYQPIPENYQVPGYVEPVSVPKDVGKGFVSGLTEGAAMIPGATSEMLQLPEKLPAYATLGSMWLAQKLGLMPPDTMENAQKVIAEGRQAVGRNEAEKEGQVDYVMGIPFPTAQGSLDLAKRNNLTYTYDPKTTAGSWTKNVASFIPQAAVPMGEATYGQRLLSNTTAGLGASTAKEALKGTDYEAPAEIIGGVIGGGTGAIGASILNARSEAMVKRRAEALAARVAQEAVPNPNATAANIANLTGPNAPEFLPGVRPTTAQLVDEPEVTAFAREMERHGRETSDPIHTERMAQENVNRDIVQGEVPKLPDLVRSKVPNAIDLNSSYGITGVNPQGAASEKTASIVSVLEKKADDAANKAWKNPALVNAGIFKDRSVGILDDFIENLDPVSREAFPSDIKGLVDAVRKEAGNTVPFESLQNLRSLVLAKARSAFNSPTPIKSADLYGFADQIDKVLSDPSNVRFNNQTAIDAWKVARQATKDYKDMFDVGIIKQMVSEQAAGMPKLAPESVLNKALTGNNAGQNVRQIRDLVGTAADEHIGDWMVGQLTKNGSDITITPEKVSAFMAKPSNASILQEVPDLRARLESIAAKAGESAEQSMQRQFQERLADAVRGGSPRALVNFVDAHADDLNRIVTDPNDRRYISALRNSAALVQSLPSGRMTGTRSLDMLSNGNIMSLLYGRATGAISNATIGAVGGAIAAKAAGVTGGLAAPVTGALLSATNTPKSVVDKLSEMTSGFFLKNTKEKTFEILQEAARDPELMKMLLMKPTAQNITWLEKYLGRTGKYMVKTGRAIRASITPIARSQFPMASRGYDQEDQEDREGRARGGRTGSKAEQLFRDLKRRKIMISNKTEQMLSMPDDVIVQALDAAKR